jgi:hypothetical protein
MLLAAVQQTGENYGPYGMRVISGYRPGDKRQHGRGNALDVELYDRESGRVLDNYQKGGDVAAYQQFANQVYANAPPELQQRMRWGGYFSGGPGKYGALDLMHFDTASQIGMAGGSWEGGFTPEMQKIWGMKDGAGTPAQARNIAQAGSPESAAAAQRYGADRPMDPVAAAGGVPMPVQPPPVIQNPGYSGDTAVASNDLLPPGAFPPAPDAPQTMRDRLANAIGSGGKAIGKMGGGGQQTSPYGGGGMGAVLSQEGPVAPAAPVKQNAMLEALKRLNTGSLVV